MFPEISYGWYILAALAVAILLAWLLLPSGWAVGLTLAIVAAFIIVVFYILSHTRFT